MIGSIRGLAKIKTRPKAVGEKLPTACGGVKIKGKLMVFVNAYNELLKGNKIARAGWKGYWYINSQTSELIIHKANGEELVNTSDNLKQTIENTLAEDWYVTDGVPVEEALNRLMGVK